MKPKVCTVSKHYGKFLHSLVFRQMWNAPQNTQNMRHLLKSEILDALKESLRDLESLRMVSAIDPELVLLKQHLQTTIEELEDENSADYQYGLAA